MASTNKTSHYELSQFLADDKPGWLTDVNSDMLKIDTGIFEAKTSADGASSSATTALDTAQAAQAAATDAKTSAESASTNAAQAKADAATALTTATNAQTTANTANTNATTAQTTATAAATAASNAQTTATNAETVANNALNNSLFETFAGTNSGVTYTLLVTNHSITACFGGSPASTGLINQNISTVPALKTTQISLKIPVIDSTTGNFKAYTTVTLSYKRDSNQVFTDISTLVGGGLLAPTTLMLV